MKNEFKIGNLIKIEGKIRVIGMISEETFSIGTKQGKSDEIIWETYQYPTENTKSIERILINDEWLIKMGFNVVGKEILGHVEYKRNGIYVSTKDGDVSGVFIGVYFAAEEIKYIHELQNIFSLLKKIDLTENITID